MSPGRKKNIRNKNVKPKNIGMDDWKWNKLKLITRSKLNIEM